MGRFLRDSVAAFAIELKLDGEALPTEFRIFRAGLNPNTNGKPVLFDDEAAALVMADYGALGIDLMIDLNHQSIEDVETSANYDPDARGWCKLEVRKGPELWAVSVKWTPDGAARLTDRRQRYVSPFFGFDKKTRRVTAIFNIALVAMPATHGAQELMAARAAVSPIATAWKSARRRAGSKWAA